MRAPRHGLLQMRCKREGYPAALRRSGRHHILFGRPSAPNLAAIHAVERAPEVAAHHVVEDRVDGCTAVIEQTDNVVHQHLPIVARCRRGTVFRLRLAQVGAVGPLETEEAFALAERLSAGAGDRFPVACEQTLQMERRPADEKRDADTHCTFESRHYCTAYLSGNFKAGCLLYKFS